MNDYKHGFHSFIPFPGKIIFRYIIHRHSSKAWRAEGEKHIFSGGNYCQLRSDFKVKLLWTIDNYEIERYEEQWKGKNVGT